MIEGVDGRLEADDDADEEDPAVAELSVADGAAAVGGDEAGGDVIAVMSPGPSAVEVRLSDEGRAELSRWVSGAVASRFAERARIVLASVGEAPTRGLRWRSA